MTANDIASIRAGVVLLWSSSILSIAQMVHEVLVFTVVVTFIGLFLVLAASNFRLMIVMIAEIFYMMFGVFLCRS